MDGKEKGISCEDADINGNMLVIRYFDNHFGYTPITTAVRSINIKKLEGMEFALK